MDYLIILLFSPKMSWRIKHFYERGTYYGFPRCCVRSFVHPIKETGELMYFRDRPKIQRLASKNGFVPCLKHAKMIVDGKIKIEDLILSTRKHPQEFKKIEKRN
jgi:hypothetical protein